MGLPLSSHRTRKTRGGANVVNNFQHINQPISSRHGYNRRVKSACAVHNAVPTLGSRGVALAILDVVVVPSPPHVTTSRPTATTWPWSASPYHGDLIPSPPSSAPPPNTAHQTPVNSTSTNVFPSSQHNTSTARMMNGKSPLHPSLGSVTASSCFGGRYSPTYRPPDSMRRCMPNPPAVRRLQLPPPHHPHAAAPGDGYPRPTSAAEMDYTNSSLRPRQCLTNLFGGLEEGLLSRAEALAAMDISKHSAAQSQGLQLKHDMMYHHHHPGMTTAPPNGRPQQLSHHMDGMDMLDSLGSSTMPPGLAPITSDGGSASHAHHALSGAPASVYSSHGMNQMMTSAHHLASHAPTVAMHDSDSDPRELEAFAERFKQRRIKLGVTQADVGKALANLKLPGVGALSQSTICRFESLTLSHNNMIALKPVLQAWLEEAEAQARNKRKDPEAPDVLPSGEKKRKRTSIAAPEKRSLEAYFAVQPRPSGEKIAAIAEKLDLKKNVVRVWFCNQRQKQKRMKFSAVNHVVNH